MNHDESATDGEKEEHGQKEIDEERQNPGWCVPAAGDGCIPVAVQYGVQNEEQQKSCAKNGMESLAHDLVGHEQREKHHHAHSKNGTDP